MRSIWIWSTGSKDMAQQDPKLDAARAAKKKAAKVFARFGRVCGVGITQRKGAWCVKVNLESTDRPFADMPATIDDVPVVVEITGKIRRQK